MKVSSYIISFFFDNISLFFCNLPALQCYTHDPCSTNCPQLSNTIRTCDGTNDRCYKAAFPGGVSRGCATDRCNVQVNSILLIKRKNNFFYIHFIVQC